MITGYNKNNNNSAMFENKEMMGLSTDVKPSEQVPVNALFLELDTGDLYYCAMQGSKEEETVFDDTIELNPSLEGVSLGVITLADTITVVFDGIEYANLQKQAGGSYGATWDESTQSIDFSVYPFRVHYSEGYDSYVVTDNVEEHTISIYSNDELVIEKTFNAYYYGQVNLDFSRELSGDINFVIGDEEYACEPQGDQQSGIYYGAPQDENGNYDFSVYPFHLFSDGFLVLSKPAGEYHISIVEDVETPATWVKYGEAPSGGNLIDGVTIEPENWVYDEGQHLWMYEVEYYPFEVGETYAVEWTRGGETAVTMYGQATADDDVVYISTDVYGVVTKDEKTYVFFNEQETETVTIRVYID